jgi:hypothetical protein
MSSKLVHAVYDDDDTLLHAVKDVKKADYHIEEVFTPFPVHGLDHAMGLAGTRIAVAAFLYGILGFSVALTMINHIMIEDWPQNIGGKPSFTFMENLPAFVPVIFEMTVFFAAHLMVITFYLRSKLWPFKKAENPMPETTDDKFLMQVAIQGDEKKLLTLLKKSGAIDISIHENHDA